MRFVSRDKTGFFSELGLLYRKMRTVKSCKIYAYTEHDY